MLQFRDIEKLQTTNLRSKRVKRVLADGSPSIVCIRYESAKIQTRKRYWRFLEWSDVEEEILSE
jgi:hypothetical protein